MSRLPIILLFILFLPIAAFTEDGYRLWLRYDLIDNQDKLEHYRTHLQSVRIEGVSTTIEAAGRELKNGLTGLLGSSVSSDTLGSEGLLIVGAYDPTNSLSEILAPNEVEGLGDEGYSILTKMIQGKKVTIITAFHDIGVLYGVFHFLKLIQTHRDISNLHIKSIPKIKIRMLNHWDNLDRTVERGYAGFSIWNWHQLPDFLDPRYVDYARANASIGINGIALTNVNANALVLRSDYLQKVKALADIFRTYGIKIYLTARFSAPIELGKKETADPLNDDVQKWWNDKAQEIYGLIPDFGGFLVKANSEGQPGPQNYNRTHAEGANMLAQAVAPFGGLVMWRAFVYSNEKPDDRHKQAYNEFVPLDGRFDSNVLIQVKNGAIDFQPREPFHPLFGAMRRTPLMMEFQITQEYLGQGTHLVYLGSMFKEVLDADTYQKGSGSIVSKVIDGSISNHALSAIAGVSNIGSDRNWTSHPFAQANWFAYGRLAWAHDMSAADIADDWIKMTFSNHPEVVGDIKKIMLESYEAAVNYMTPLGLHHIMGAGHHYGPGPWIDKMPRADWTSTYYHQADSIGIGFNRTSSGSDALSQYKRQVERIFEDPENCPDKYILWFHHLDWDHPMTSGKTLWDEICHHYQKGVEQVQTFQKIWQKLDDHIDHQRFTHVTSLLRIQAREARWWKDACLSYFQTFSGMDFPDGVSSPTHNLEYYMSLSFPYAPGIRPRW